MAVRYISKGKGKNRKSFPIRPKKKGVSVRSVSLRPSAVVKINKEQIKLINRGQPATFSKALNEVIIRAKRDGVPIYDTHVNSNDRRKPYKMWIVKHPDKGDKIKGSETIVMAEHYGQAIDDFITIWNKDKRMNKTIGYPQVQGTAEKTFRYAREVEKKYSKEELEKAFADYRERIPEKDLKKDGHGKYRIQVAGKVGDDNWLPFNMNVTANSKAEAEEDVRNTVGLHGTPLLLAIKLKE